MTTTDQLAAIEARAHADTEGPWVHAGSGYVEVPPVSDPHRFDEMGETVARVELTDADAEFIANARMDVPALLAHIREQQAKLDRVAALAEEWRYKGEFGWGAWQEGEGPDQEGLALDHAAGQIRAAITATEAGE